MNSRFSVVGIVCVLGLLLTGCGGGPSNSFVKETFKEDNPTTSVPIDGATLDNRIVLDLTDSDIFNSYSKKIDNEKIFFFKIRATYEWDVKAHPDQLEIIKEEIKKETAYQDNRHKDTASGKYVQGLNMVNSEIKHLKELLEKAEKTIKDYPLLVAEYKKNGGDENEMDIKLRFDIRAYKQALQDRDQALADNTLQNLIDKRDKMLALQKEENEEAEQRLKRHQESDVVIPVYVKKVYEHTCSFIEEGNEWRYNIGDGTYIESVTRLSDGTVNKHKGS